ncbi:MAG: NF038122 family metalloprotease, partial [Proteobacteria bacterium]|nr:NF038122 family metalloprotease [Pseudomonadota bacterium]
MTLPTEAVTLAGSGLTFINDYDSTVTAAYRTAIIAAENLLQAQFTNQITLNVNFSFAPLGAGTSASNNFSEVNVSYSAFRAALVSHATTADDQIAVANLPTTDPSGGVGFALPRAYAVMLGLAAQTNLTEDAVTLNSNLPFTFGQDAIGAIDHEITEGLFGRTASLGIAETRWDPLDLFRFTASGQRDYTGGQDGVATFFGIASNNVSSLPYHNSVNAAGQFDGSDLGDWGSSVVGDSFGPGGPGSPGSVSATDLKVLDVLGWTPTSSSGPFVPAADDFANSLADTSHPFGHLTVGSSATGALQQAGDHDLFAVQL